MMDESGLLSELLLPPPLSLHGSGLEGVEQQQQQQKRLLLLLLLLLLRLTQKKGREGEARTLRKEVENRERGVKSALSQIRAKSSSLSFSLFLSASLADAPLCVLAPAAPETMSSMWDGLVDAICRPPR